MERTKSRERWIDVIRGFAIYLVVLGHSIQYATPEGYEFQKNAVFQFIYGFHMPLFMIVSGYLFWYSLNRYSLGQGLLAKLKGIMVPCAAWGFVTWVCDLVLISGFDGAGLKSYLVYTAFSNWFLWAVFYCSLYGFVTKYLFRSHIWGYAVVLLVNYVIPDIGNYAGTKRMLPFFVMGMLLNRYALLERVQGGMKRILLILLLGVMYVLSLRLQCVELITGTIGSAFFITAFYSLCGRFSFGLLRRLGEVSICIYLFTGIVFYFWIRNYFRISESYRYRIRLSYVLLVSVVLTALAYAVGRLLQKSKVTSRMFLGR